MAKTLALLSAPKVAPALPTFHHTTDENLVVWTSEFFKDGSMVEQGHIHFGPNIKDRKHVAELRCGWAPEPGGSGQKRAVIASVYYGNSTLTRRVMLKAEKEEIDTKSWNEWEIAKAYAEKTVRECAAFL
jgi:hypothetical protein